jgi:hypothetical protein
MGALAAVAFLFVFGWLFYRYSGAQWNKLAFVFLNRGVMEGEWGPLFAGLLMTLEIAFFSADTGAEGGDNDFYLFILQHLVETGLLHVEHFAAEGQNRLIFPIPTLFGAIMHKYP